MKRVLDFSGPKAAKRFQLVWTSLMSAGDGKSERSREIIRKEARIQDTFIEVSNNGGDEVNRTLKGDCNVTLPQDEFDLVVQYSEKTQWNPAISRDVVDLWDWLSASERVD